VAASEAQEGREVHYLANGHKHHFEAGVIFPFQLFEFAGQLFVRRKNRSYPDKSLHHLNTRLNCHRAVQDACQHHHAVLREGVGRKARVAVLLGTGRNLRPVQLPHFPGRKAKHEILRKAGMVAFNLLVEPFRRYPIDLSEVRVEHDPDGRE
jgi:hypothetical protein